MTNELVVNDAYLSEMDKAPFKVEVFRTGWACITGKSNMNVLRFRSKPGAVFTNEATAIEILKKLG